MCKRLFLFCLSLLAVCLPAWAQRRDPLEYIRILESADRVRMLQVNRVIQTLKVTPGETVADLGAGSGLFSRPLARAVGPDGVVYAIDIDSSMLDHIEETAREQNLANIRTVLASEVDPRLPGKVDLILICDTLHQIQQPDQYVKRLARYLNPAGRVAIIDYERNWPKRLEAARYTVHQLTEWMAAAGFEREETHRFLKGNFFVTFRFVSPTP